MEGERMIGDVYEDLMDRLATVRTRALMGERETAFEMLRGACLELKRYREILKDYPGFHALEAHYDAALTSLCAEVDRAEVEAMPTHETREKAAAALPLKTRRKSRRAA